MASIPLGGGVGFLLKWVDIEPRTDIAWQLAPVRRRTAWRKAVSDYAAQVWRDSRAKGLDRHGRRLRPLAASTIRYRRSAMGVAVANAPALTPANAESRTRAFLRWKVRDDGVWFYWRWDFHTRRYWGEILQYHAGGSGHLPIRDVIGMSPAETAAIRAWGLALWRGQRLKAASEGSRDKERIIADETPKRKRSNEPKGRKPVPIPFNVDNAVFSGGTAAQIRRMARNGTLVVEQLTKRTEPRGLDRLKSMKPPRLRKK